jgi:type I restriction enzyme, S subunit
MVKLEVMPKYNSYRKSGEDWIGDVPAYWGVKSVKAVLQERIEKNDPIKTKNILSLCMYRGVIPYSEKGASGNKAKDDLTAYRLAYPGDIVLNSMNVIAGSVGLSKYFGAVSPVYYMLRPRKDSDHVAFFNEIFQNEAFQKSLIGLGNGILIKKSESSGKLNTIRMKIPMIKLNKVLLPCPPENEQLRILHFLRVKTAKINEAIAIKEKQIALLKEHKQIIIQKAVTQGLNPDVSMKDSGVDWIGQIPEHWEARRVKHLFKLIVEPSEKNNSHELLSVYTDIGVKPRRELEERGNKASTTDGYWFVKRGDIVVNKLLAWMGAIGISDYDGVTSPAYDILRPKVEMNGYFYHLLFRSSFCSSELKRHSRGIMEMRLRLYFDKFGVIEVPFPPIEEQNEIINALNKKLASVNGGIDLLNQQIGKLKEYRTTLINHAVTGKIKVA